MRNDEIKPACCQAQRQLCELPPQNPTRRHFLSAAAVLGSSSALFGASIAAAETPSDRAELDSRRMKLTEIIRSDPAFEGMNPPDTQGQRLTDLVLANHILADQNFNDMFGHVSVRSQSNPKHYFMSKSRAPELVIPDDIMEFDENSAPLDQRGRVMYEERYIHSEIYRARPDVGCVIHSHTPALIPFGVTTVPLRPIMHTAAYLPQEVPVFEIRDVEGDDSDLLVTNPRSGAALAKTLGEGTAVLMRGHGCAVVGPNVRLAVYHALYLKQAAEIQTVAQNLGTGLNFLNSKERQNMAAKLALMGVTGPLRGWPIWERRALANLEHLLGL